jgi:chromosome segregation protein
LIASFARIKKAFSVGKTALVKLEEKASEFEILKDGLKEEFAEIERKLADELKLTDAKAIRTDEFRQLQKTLEEAKQALEELTKQESRQIALRQGLLQELATLNNFWHQEYKTNLIRSTRPIPPSRSKQSSRLTKKPLQAI